MTRVWLQPAIVVSDNQIDLLNSEVDSLRKKVESNREQIESNEKKADAANTLAKAALGVPIPPPQASAEGLTMASAESGTDIWDTDPHKGQFGGSPDSDGRRLSAVIQALSPNDSTCKIYLKVESIDPQKPLTGSVRFFLHPTFDPDEELIPVNNAGVARLTIHADGPFTVGAEADGGATRLELDLSELPGGTDEFYED